MTTPVPFEKKLEVKGGSLETKAARQGFLVNVFSNVGFIVAQTVVSLWMTPYLIGQLGIAAFGMIPLVNTLTSYLSVFTAALNSAISRFLGIDLGRGDDVAANRTFNTALFGLIVLIIALIPAAVATSLVFPAIFKVPLGWERDVSWLFAIVAAAFFVTVISGIFALSPFIHSRFLLSNIANFAGLLARLVITIALFTALRARLWYVGGGILAGALVSLCGYTLLWRKLTPQLHVRVSEFDRSRMRPLTAMGGWMVVNMVGAMLLDRVDLIVVNIYYGAAVTGGYGAVVQLAVLVDSLVTVTSTVIRPVILLKYAQGDLLGLQHIASQSVKLLGLALALPVGLMCGFSRPLISIWLGPSLAYLSLLLVIVVCHLSLNLSVRPLLYVHNAYNKVRWPGIVTLLCGVASVTADILVAQWGKWAYLGIAASTAVIWTFKNAFYMPIYTSHIMRQPWWTFLPCLTWSIIGTLFVGFAAYGLSLVYMPSNWFTLTISAAFVSLVYAGFVWAIGLDRVDKQLLMDLFHLNRIAAVRSPMKG